ncbi:GntR family transcriptional regulator, partial [bacterium]|nr:GntR family transcriptional regulator [bacterium]
TRGSKITSIKRKILVALEENQGWLPLSDKSDPDEIQRVIGASKKVFKRTIGTLYKERRVRFERNGIRLVVK